MHMTAINPFIGSYDKLKQRIPNPNPIKEIVNTYYFINGIDKKPKEFYHGRYGYARLMVQAKALYTACNENFDDCIWALDRMKYLADKGKFDWSISTCLKHKKL